MLASKWSTKVVLIAGHLRYTPLTRANALYLGGGGVGVAVAALDDPHELLHDQEGHDPRQHPQPHAQVVPAARRLFHLFQRDEGFLTFPGRIINGYTS